MNDYISRQAAIDAIEGTDWYHINKNGVLVHGANSETDIPLYKADDVYKVLAGLPSADRRGRWIPVTERLPELYTNVLLSVRQGYAFGEPDNWCVVGQLIDKADITWATNYGFHDLLYSNGIKHTVWVSAWMPLPEPMRLENK